MDKIFKNKFKNFEKKAPDSAFDNILDKVSNQAIQTVPSNFLFIKVACIVLVAIVSAIALYMIFAQEKKTIPVKKSLIVKNESKIKESQSSKININKEQVEDVKQVEKTIVTTKNTSQPTKIENKSILAENAEKTKKEVIIIEKRNLEINIEANRFVCGGECTLKVNSLIEGGEWLADKNINIENPNKATTIVRTNKAQKVLFTFVKEEQRDTFTVFFNHADKLKYSIQPESCLGNDGALVLDLPENRSFYSNNDVKFENNKFVDLTHNNYLFELKDKYNCEYKIQVNIPQERLSTEITFDALETKINYPIYFETNIENADYNWDFGDNLTSSNKNPNHKYGHVGSYTVKLFVSKGSCKDTVMLRNLVIEDGSIELPNIFTPNNDGKNDVFKIKTPDSLISFEAIIMSKEGKLVYKWTDSNKGWDGLLMNGQEAKIGSYYYIIKGVDDKGKSFEYKSYLELNR